MFRFVLFSFFSWEVLFLRLLASKVVLQAYLQVSEPADWIVALLRLPAVAELLKLPPPVGVLRLVVDVVVVLVPCLIIGGVSMSGKAASAVV